MPLKNKIIILLMLAVSALFMYQGFSILLQEEKSLVKEGADHSSLEAR